MGTLDITTEIEQLAHRLADEARKAILPYFRTRSLVADNKLADGFDPVTEADRAAEKAMRNILDRERPNDSILGEEFGVKNGSSGLTWVLDPVDGTRGFIAGTPTWGVLIAVQNVDGPVLGIIDQPYIGERFVGSPNDAYVDGPIGRHELQTHHPRSLRDAIVMTTFPEVGTATEGKAFQTVASQARLTRYGMDCYGYALVASGQVDLVIEAGLAPYDIAAPIAVVQAAGGIVTDWTGKPAHNGGRAIAAANEEIHAEALALLAPFAD